MIFVVSSMTRAGDMTRRFGFELLEDQAGEAAREFARDHVSQLTFCRNFKNYDIWGDTEIEKLFFLAMDAHSQFGAHEHRELIRLANDDEPSNYETLALLIKRQVQITDNWRADFVVSLMISSLAF